MDKKLRIAHVIAAIFVALPSFLTAVSCRMAPEEGNHVLHIYTTNDVHGRYFDSLYVGGGTRTSMMAVSAVIKEARTPYGAENVILIDAGDGFQGDNAAYYSNYVDTVSRHIFARITEYMGYDALVVGNHDIETGHGVYDRLRRDLKMPYLAANAICDDNGKSYFDGYTVIRRHGLKILVAGFTNANIKGWLSPELWKGMNFRSLIPFVQEELDRIRTKTKPDLVIVATHTGTGPGDGSQIESQGRDLLYSIKGVDFLICSHDHRAYVEENDGCHLINAGSHCRNIGHGIAGIKVEKGRVVSKSLSAELIEVDRNAVDEDMREEFAGFYSKVRELTVREVGELAMPLVTRDAYTGMSDYVNLIHTVCLGCTPACISIAAPLTFNGTVPAGKILFNDLFTIYPFENQLFIVKMTGRELKGHLECSYDRWINAPAEGGHLLKIVQEPDRRTGALRWTFDGMPYNFDSAAGVNYTVDVTKEYGNRIDITSLTDGTPFDPDATYNVAMTSYRASGGGGLLQEGAGIDTDRIDERVVARYPEIRELVLDFIEKYQIVTPELAGDRSLLGEWRFVPEDLANPMLEKDMKLLFGK